MAEEAQTEEEPSIEEILDSIRQIISEDDESGEAASESDEESSAEEDAPALDQDAIDDMDFDAPVDSASENVELDQGAIDDMDFDAPVDSASENVELDQGAIDDIAFDTPEPEAAAEPEIVAEAKEAVIDLVEKVEPEPEENVQIEVDMAPEPEEIPEPQPVMPDVDLVDAGDGQGEASLLTQGAEKAAVSAITELVRKTAVEHNGITLEDIVRSELKPMLKEWLDRNLPIIIERLVQEELERVSKRVLDE
ncbi:MAG: DUF2497 domain-containing protein [Alphaproteobacteria bacterium]